MSSDELTGPYGSAGGRGTDGKGKYPEPEGWAKDGYWRDPSIDSDYETGLTGAVRPAASDRGKSDGGYSYWSDGKGWENSPGSGGTPGNESAGAGGAHSTRMDSYATRADYGARAGGASGTRASGTRAANGGRTANGANGADATAFYGAGAAAPTTTYGTGRGPAGYRDGRPAPGPGRRGTKGGAPGGPGGPGRGGKVKGSWWRRWTWKKALAIMGAAFAVFLLLVVGAYYYLYNSTQIPTQEVADITFQNSSVYYSDGTTAIGTFGTIHRQILAYNQIPKVVQDAVVAAEDRGFWTEGGISPTGILRAAYDDLTSSGGSLSGGSTITQQFVRNYYQDIGTSQTASRKIKEIFVAMKLAKEKSKPWILTNYLNTIYLGTGAYGVAAASQTYFHEPVSKLTVAQAAVIAAIIQQPTNYPQPQYRPELEARWHYVLNGMVTMGDLTAQQAATMKFPSMYDTPEQSYGSDPWDPYVMNVVTSELGQNEHISLNDLDTKGYKIVTTISRPMEVALYHAVDYNVDQMRLDGGPLPWYALIGAELQNPANGSIIAMYAGRGENMSSTQCAKYDCQDNTAVYAREQVGSSFKPYVLATAVNEGMNVKTSILNGYSPLWVPPDTTTADQLTLSARSQAQALPESYPITNDGNASYGAMNVQNAFAQSSNTAFSDLAHRAGTQNIINMAESMGVSSLSYKQGGPGLEQYHNEVGLALGIAPLTVNEQDTMLSTIDDNGTYHSAHVVKSITYATGGTTPGLVSERQVLTPALDSQVQYAMSMVTVDGTGTAAEMSDGRPIIAKTGTTDNAQSAFFIGAIPQYALTVGIFTQNQSTNTSQSLNGLGGNVGGGFGGYWPARIWNTFAEAEFAKLPIEQFLSPVFTGAKWNQVGNIPKKKKKQPKHGGTPTPTPGHGHHGHNPFPTPTPTFTIGQPTTTPSATASPTGTATATPTSTATATGPPVPGGAATAAAKVNGVQAGAALGGVFSVLPGSLLWARTSRRRRRRRTGVVG